MLKSNEINYHNKIQACWRGHKMCTELMRMDDSYTLVILNRCLDKLTYVTKKRRNGIFTSDISETITKFAIAKKWRNGFLRYR